MAKIMAFIMTFTMMIAPVNKNDRELLAQVMYWENYNNGEEAASHRLRGAQPERLLRVVPGHD